MSDRDFLAAVRERVVVFDGGMGATLEQFAWTWLAAGGDGSGPPPSDEEAIELLTTMLHSGIAGRG